MGAGGWPEPPKRSRAVSVLPCSWATRDDQARASRAPPLHRSSLASDEPQLCAHTSPAITGYRTRRMASTHIG